MSRNYFEALPGDRAHAILSEYKDEHVEAFLDLYEEAVGVFTQGRPEPHHLSTHKKLHVRDSQDDKDHTEGKFTAIDQSYTSGGGIPCIKRFVDIDIRPAHFSLSSMARLKYGIRAEASSSLELRLEAKTEPYELGEKRGFCFTWKLTTANGTEGMGEDSEDPHELSVEEVAIQSATVNGDIRTLSKRTALHIARLTVNGETQTETKHSESRDPIDPITMLENSRSQVLFPASLMLVSAGVQKT